MEMPTDDDEVSKEVPTGEDVTEKDSINYISNTKNESANSKEAPKKESKLDQNRQQSRSTATYNSKSVPTPEDERLPASNTGTSVDRRSLLKFAGVAVSGAVGTSLAGGAVAETTRGGVTFDTVLNAVEDLGMDSSGNTPIDGALSNGLSSGTLIEFPPGTYLVSQSHSIENLDRIGLRGLGESRRDVQFIPSSGRDIRMLASGRGGSGQVLLENLSFNDRSDDSSILSIFIRTSGGSVARNIEWLGRTPQIPQGTGTDFQFGTEVNTQSGVFLVEDVYAGIDEPAVPAPYPDGVGFFWSGPGHSGEVILRNPVIHNRNSAATRYNAGSGVVTIEGGEFIDCQNASVRFGAGTHPTKTSSCTGTYIKVSEGISDTGTAVRIGATTAAESGALCKDMEIEWYNQDAFGVFSLVDFSSHGSATIDNCIVRNDGSNSPNVLAQSPGGGSDVAVTVENSSFTGSGSGEFIAQNRPGSVVRDCCISMPNASFSGFATENISTSNCRRPQNGDGSADDGDSEETLEHNLTISGTGTATNYELTVTDEIKPHPTDGTFPDGSYEGITDQTANGWVSASSDVDGFTFSGEIEGFEILEGGPIDIRLDGESVSVDELTGQPTAAITVTETDGLTVGLSGAESSDPDGEIVTYEWSIDSETREGEELSYTFDASGTYTISLTVEDDTGATASDTTEMTVTDMTELTIRGTGTTTNYSFEVDGAIQPQEETIEPWDEVTETDATGWVSSPEDADSFLIDGEITNFEFLKGEADTYIDGEEVTLVSQTKELTIRGTGITTNYSFEVDGTVEPQEETIESWDEVTETGATGWVTSTEARDRFTIDGEFTSFEFLKGEAAIYLDGEEVSISSLV